MRSLRMALALVASLVAFACPAQAQNEFKTPQAGKPVVGFQVMCQNGSGQAVPCSNAFPLSITGSISAALGGFQPSAAGARGTPISVTTSDSSGTLPTGAVVDVSNVGSNPMYCNVNGIAATASDKLIAANSWFEFTIPATITTLHCIATGGSTTANMVGGSGLGTGAGGGSSGSGGAVNLTQILGAAPSLTNPLWVSPASGATFPVSGTFWQTTQPVSSTTLATSANQATNGATTAHTCNITGYSELGCLGQIDDDIKVNIPGVSGPLAASSSGLATFSLITGAQYLTTAPTLTNLQQASLLLQPRNGLTVATGLDPFTVTGAGGTFPVTGTFWQATQPVSIASMPSTPVTGTFWQTTQPISGTVQPGNTPNTTAWLANPTSQYPSGAIPLTASATGTTGATTATLAGTSGKTTYLCSYSIRANATAATTVTNTITGVITATLSHIMWVAPAASGIGIDEQIFNPCVPASGTNTGVAIVSGAPGTGGNVSATATGYQL